MNEYSESILVFGGGILQHSIIEECKKKNLFTVVIDPNPKVAGSFSASKFEVVDGNDFDATCEIIEKYNIKGLITSSTDKPLFMMAKVALRYNLPFISPETAKICTHKNIMKEVFVNAGIPCAKGKLIQTESEIDKYPVIIKPLDSSGSRGVFYCNSDVEAQQLLKECFNHTSKSKVLAEEVIEGNEYSIEAIHFEGKTKLIQVTQKITTPFPTNVEIAHISPAKITDNISKEIFDLIDKIAKEFNFNHCASHTEIKINEDKIIVIETSPRLGGDFITSKLVPLSNGVNIESMLINIALGKSVPKILYDKKVAGIFYFYLTEDTIVDKINFESFKKNAAVKALKFDLNIGDKVPAIKNSIDRYGYFILQTLTFDEFFSLKEKIENSILLK